MGGMSRAFWQACSGGHDNSDTTVSVLCTITWIMGPSSVSGCDIGADVGGGSTNGDGEVTDVTCSALRSCAEDAGSV